MDPSAGQRCSPAFRSRVDKLLSSRFNDYIATWDTYEDMWYIVEQEKGEIVACIALWLQKPFSIWNVAVRKDKERQRLGTRMVTAALDWYCKHHLFDPVWVYFSKPALREFYSTFGFVAKKVRKPEQEGETMVWQRIRRSKRLRNKS